MPIYTYQRLSPIPLGMDEATHRTHTDADDHDIWAAPYVALVAGRIIAMRYQVTVTTLSGLVAAVIRLAVADHDGTTNQAEVTGSPTTIASAVAAANTIYEVLINGGQGYAVTAGQTVFANVKTAATDAGVVAGSVRVFAVFQPGSM